MQELLKSDTGFGVVLIGMAVLWWLVTGLPRVRDETSVGFAVWPAWVLGLAGVLFILKGGQG